MFVCLFLYADSFFEHTHALRHRERTQSEVIPNQQSKTNTNKNNDGRKKKTEKEKKKGEREGERELNIANAPGETEVNK